MSSPIWTAAALVSEARPYQGLCWRLVEAQHLVSTQKLTDSLDEQRMLEELLDASKPALPPECRHLSYLFFTPFRYRPYPHGSRFRSPGFSDGVYYAAEKEMTAVAEMAFYRLLFFAESPLTPWPANPFVLTAFSASVSGQCLDLTHAPFVAEPALMNLTDYSACQSIAATARLAGLDMLRYTSVRDPAAGSNIALLACRAFAAPHPQDYRTWRLALGEGGVIATREFPHHSVNFTRDDFAKDPRLHAFNWRR